MNELTIYSRIEAVKSELSNANDEDKNNLKKKPVGYTYRKRCELAIEYINRLDKDYDINVYQEDKHWAYVLYILNGDDKSE